MLVEHIFSKGGGGGEYILTAPTYRYKMLYTSNASLPFQIIDKGQILCLTESTFLSGSPLFPTFSALSRGLLPLLLNVTSTPSIQPNLGLPRTRPPYYFHHQLPSGHEVLIHSFHMPKHLNTLGSSLLANSLPIRTLLQPLHS